MWRLPLDLNEVSLEIPLGEHLLPWHWTDQDIDRVVCFMSRVLPNVSIPLEIPPKALSMDATSIKSAHRAMGVVRAIPDHEEETIKKAAANLGCPHLFVQFLRPMHREPFEWAQGQLRPLLRKTLEIQLGDDSHPLTQWKVRNLDIALADRLASDVAELIALVESTLRHRLSNCDLGLDEKSYLRSLLLATGFRLAQRIGRLRTEEMGPAVEVLLTGDRAVASSERGRIGVDALLRSGLASGGREEVRLAALATPLAHAEVWGQLWQNLPHEAWTPLARELLRHLRTDQKSGLRRRVTSREGGERTAPQLCVDVIALRGNVAERLDDVESGLAAVELLDEMHHIPHYISSVPERVRYRSEACFKRLSRSCRVGSPKSQVFARTLHSALSFWSARGLRVVDQQRKALAHLDEACSHESPDGTCADLLGAARIFFARSIVGAPSKATELIEAEKLANLERERIPADSRSRAHLDSILGQVAYLQGRMDEAERWFRKALKGFESVGDQTGLKEIHHRLGRVAHDRGDLDGALLLYQQALAHAEELADREGMGSNALALGDAAFLMGDDEKAKAWYRKALEAFETLGDTSGSSVTHRKLGIVAEERGDHSRARQHYQQALELDERLGNRASLASSHHHMGNVAYRVGELDQAKRWYSKALENFDELGNQTGLASSYHQLGLVDQRLGNMDEALKLYEKALEIFTEQQNQSGMAAALHQLGMIASESCDVDEALKNFQRSLEVKKDQGDEPGAASSMSQIGVLHTQCGRPEEGVSWNLQAISLRHRLGLPLSRLDLHWLGKQREMLGEKRFIQILTSQLDSELRIDEVMEMIDVSRTD